MFIDTETADKYQEFFNFFSQEHNLILTITEMNEILLEARKLDSELQPLNQNKMTPKEKADELYVGYWYLTNDSRIAKQCALIAVDEILNNFGSTADGKHFFTAYSTLEYWQEVKNEINNL